MKELIVLVGPPCAGKSTLATNYPEYTIANQDEYGKQGHLNLFNDSIRNGLPVVIDRMNFNKEQRQRYIVPAKEVGYKTKIIVLHENRATCLSRGWKRLEVGEHQTVKTEEDLRRAISFFFSHYERPTEDEADIVEYRYPELSMKLHAVVSDLDGTLANLDHRQDILRNNGGKKNWKGFFDAMDKDTPVAWCREILNTMREKNIIVLCSGRPDSYQKITKDWLRDNKVYYDQLFMRPRSDHRPDTIVKEIILDFEMLTRYSSIKVWIDDRKCVIDKIRERGVTVLDCAGEKGDF